MEMYLRCAVQDSPKTWKSWLSLAELWYNSSFHTSLGCSPFKALYGYDPKIGAVPSVPASTLPSVTEVIENRELHLQSLKDNLARAQNRMKMLADKKRQYFSFAVGDQVLLKLQPYTQSSVANRPFPKLAKKYFGPFRVLERIGDVAYRLDLLDGSKIHNVFHISQLKPFNADYSPVYEALPVTTGLEAAAAIPQSVVDKRLVKKGNSAIPQVRVTWTGLPLATTTWEDYQVLKQRFPNAPAWGQAATQGGESVTWSRSRLKKEKDEDVLQEDLAYFVVYVY